VAVDVNIVAIGAKGADAAGDDSGAAYVYNLANASADIVVTGDVSPDPGAVGGVLIYMFTATNNGPADAAGVLLVADISNGATITSASSTQGACNGAGCKLGAIANGATATVTFLAIPSATGTVSGTAKAASAVNDAHPDNSNVAMSSVVQQAADNTATGTEVTIQPVDPRTGTFPVTATFAQVDISGLTTLSNGFNGPGPPTGYTLIDPPLAYDLSTNAAHTGAIDVGVSYSGETFTSSESGIALFQLQGSTWTDRTTSLDTGNHVISGQVSSLSTLAIFEVQAAPPTAPVPGLSGMALVVLASAIGATVLVQLRRDRGAAPG
tara:strand:+ start:157 stop:1128 length:972 start_codon:yes stop_codon:yes gene_type:complete